MVPAGTAGCDTAFTVSIDHRDAGSGIGAHDRALTIRKRPRPRIASRRTSCAPATCSRCVRANGGVLERRGHTEAAVDLARLAGLRAGRGDLRGAARRRFAGPVPVPRAVRAGAPHRDGVGGAARRVPGRRSTRVGGVAASHAACCRRGLDRRDSARCSAARHEPTCRSPRSRPASSFPKGPVAMADGSVLVVELLRRLHHAGAARRHARTTVAEPGGSPNGAGDRARRRVVRLQQRRLGLPRDHGGFTIPDTELPAHYSGGRIERIDLDSGDVKVLYTECDGNQLIGPNDIVFDAHGGMWFTDHGTSRGARAARRRDLLRAARRFVDPRGRVPVAIRRTASACRPTARACTRPRRTPAACTRGT